MSTPKNQAAWLPKAGSPLEVGEAPMPTAGAGEIVIKNAAIAINPLDWHMQDAGVFVQQWPAILGCDVAGEVHAVGSGVDRFQKGDCVIGWVLPRSSSWMDLEADSCVSHCINLVTGRPSDGAFALYTVVPAAKAARLPDGIAFTDGVVVPFALEAAACALCVQEPGPCMPSVDTPALGLPYPTLEESPPPAGKTLVVYGASSSVGAMTTQLAAAAGIRVVAVAGARNHDMVRRCAAVQVFDHSDAAVVENVVAAVKANIAAFVGIFDAISTPDTYARDLAILAQLSGGHLACVHPPPEGVPANVTAGMIFAVNDVAAPVFRDFVTPALQSGRLRCLPPPTVVGKGLQHVNEALKMSKAGVSATKLVVEL